MNQYNRLFLTEGAEKFIERGNCIVVFELGDGESHVLTLYQTNPSLKAPNWSSFKTHVRKVYGRNDFQDLRVV